MEDFQVLKPAPSPASFSPSNSATASPNFHVINPRAHGAKADTVSIRVPGAEGAVAGLQDEGAFPPSFFGGWVFGVEEWVMRYFGGVLVLLGCFEGIQDKPSKKILWHAADIPKSTLPPTGDMVFDFLLVATHIHIPNCNPTPTSGSTSTSLPGYSYADYGFGSDGRGFAGAHRFAVVRKEREVEREKEE
ncbi:hypothetical protein LARI1_G004575, partial [Lachnellula arida]